ncbi:MAG: hypothetical protein ABIP06_10050 [Pyrinomonadaceae bacterium]
MKDITRLKTEEFETLLGWFSEDRERAGEEYNKIRESLIRFFRFKGCSDSQSLADETINRVAEKIRTFDESKNVKKISIFYGFASNIFREYLRTSKRRNEKLNSISENRTTFAEMDEDLEDGRIECLNQCLKELSAEDRTIFIEYYAPGKEKKSAARRMIAERINCEMNALQVRVFRLRGVLAKCIGKCMKKSL